MCSKYLEASVSPRTFAGSFCITLPVTRLMRGISGIWLWLWICGSCRLGIEYCEATLRLSPSVSLLREISLSAPYSKFFSDPSCIYEALFFIPANFFLSPTFAAFFP